MENPIMTILLYLTKTKSIDFRMLKKKIVLAKLFNLMLTITAMINKYL